MCKNSLQIISSLDCWISKTTFELKCSTEKERAGADSLQWVILRAKGDLCEKLCLDNQWWSAERFWRFPTIEVYLSLDFSNIVPFVSTINLKLLFCCWLFLKLRRQHLLHFYKSTNVRHQHCTWSSTWSLNCSPQDSTLFSKQGGDPRAQRARAHSLGLNHNQIPATTVTSKTLYL